MATGLVWDERFMWHDVGHGSLFLSGGWIEPGDLSDTPTVKRRLKNLLDVSGISQYLIPVVARQATLEEVLRFHGEGYVDAIRCASARGGGDAGETTPFGSGGYEVALLAAGGCIAAVDAVLRGEIDNAYALVRPPGHHAEKNRGRGSCIFANVAIAAMHAQHAQDVSRIAVIDWDVHHGNGTQEAFYESSDVLTISIHQDRAYPTDTGGVEERGVGLGDGFNINVPLPPGSGNGAYRDAMERVVLPALNRFGPELIIVANGLDASFFDPMGRQMLHSESYRSMTRHLLEAASKHARGRIVFCQEGGYSTGYVPFCGLAIVEELVGVRTDVVDPFLLVCVDAAGQDLQVGQAEAVLSAVEAFNL